MKTVMDAMAECLAGMTNNDVSPSARRKIEACLKAAISASPAGVVKPWRLDKALAGYETVMDGSHEAILRFASEDEFLFFIDAMAKGRIMSAIEPAGVGVETPPPSTHVVPQFLPTEDGEFNGNVGELIVPPHCSGYSFVFEPGVLHVKKDGSGYIAVNEEDFVLEDDRDCEGGSIHWIARMAASEITALRDFLNGTPQQQENAMTEDQIKHMVNRFLGWKLPENFNPDGGVSFQKTFNEHTDHPMKHEPSGTNLLDASQAETMIRYLLEGLPPSQHVAGISDDIRSYLEGVVGVVEANSFESMCLWQRWQEMGKSWVSTGHGYLATVGHVGDMPVCISILTVTVDGQKILFIEPTSQVVDYRMVEEWLKTHVVTALRDDGYLNRADAMNFSNVLGRRAALATTEGKEG